MRNMIDTLTNSLQSLSMTQCGYLVIMQFCENTQNTSNEPIYLF